MKTPIKYIISYGVKQKKLYKINKVEIELSKLDLSG